MHTSKASNETIRLAEYLAEKHGLSQRSALIGMKTDQILLQQKEGFSYHSSHIIAVVINYIDQAVRVQLRRGNGIPVGGINAGYQGVNSIDELDIMIAMYAGAMLK